MAKGVGHEGGQAHRQTEPQQAPTQPHPIAYAVVRYDRKVLLGVFFEDEIFVLKSKCHENFKL